MASDRSSRRRFALGVGVVLAVAAAGSGLLDAPSSARAEEAAPEEGYVGSDVCRQCHANAHEAWASSPHALTFLPASAEILPEVVVKGGTASHPPGTSRFSAADGRFLVQTPGPDGKPTTYPITHVVGRRRVRMFLTRLEDGRLQVLPFMEEGTTGRFFDYTHLIFGGPEGAADPDRPPVVEPGDPSFWTGPERAFDARCIRCHVSGVVPRGPGTPERPSHTTWRALGIDCEACHGPGEGHAAIYHGTPGAPDRDPMFAHRTFTREQAVGACTVCHMEAEVIDRTWRPGDDVWEKVDPILLDDPEQIDPAGRPLELVYAGIPFAVSECARAGGLTCGSCHLPHGGPHTALMRTEPTSDEQCASCHVAVVEAGVAHTHHEAAGAGARCVHCHMPFLRIERGHGFVADHTIGIPRLDVPGDRVAQDACTWCHTGGLGAPVGAPALAAPRLREAYAAWWPDPKPLSAWVKALAAGRLGDAAAVPALAAVAADEAVPPLARATAAWLLQRFPESAKPHLMTLRTSRDSLVRRRAVGALAALEGADVDAALLEALEDPSAAVRRHAARGALQGFERVRKNADLLRAVLPVLAAEAEAVPDDDQRWFRLGAAREVAGDLPGAIEAYERQVALDPFATFVREHLGRLREKARPR